MKQNIGIAGRYTRLVTGILALNYSVNTRRGNHLGRSLLASLGAMKIAEGIVGWCPTVEICNRIFSANENLLKNPQNKELKPQAKSQAAEPGDTIQNQKAYHANHSDLQNSDLQNTPDDKRDESKVTKSSKHNSETESEVRTEIEAF